MALSACLRCGIGVDVHMDESGVITCVFRGNASPASTLLVPFAALLWAVVVLQLHMRRQKALILRNEQQDDAQTKARMNTAINMPTIIQ